MLIFSYKVSQSLRSLTLTKFYMQTKKKRREYYSTVLMRKKCALNLVACGVLPQVVSSLFISPCGRWASSLFNFTHCHMGPRTHIEHELTRHHVDWLIGQLDNIRSYTLSQ